MPSKLEFTPEQLAVIDRALQALPYHMAAPLIAEINRQLAEAQLCSLPSQ